MSIQTISYIEGQRENLPPFVDQNLEQAIEGFWWIVQDYDQGQIDILTGLRDTAGITGIKPGNSPGGDPNA